MRVLTRAVLTATTAALVAFAAYGGAVPTTVVALGLVVAVAAGWPLLLRLPSPVGPAVVIAVAGTGAVVTVAVTKDEPYLSGVPVVVAVAVLLAFVNELARQDGRLRLVESVTGTVSGVLVVTAAAGWVAAERGSAGSVLAICGAVALAVAAAASALPLRASLAAVVTTTAGVLAGGVTGAVLDLGILPGAVLGLVTGILVAALHVLLEGVPALARRTASLAALVLPVAISGMLVHVVGRLLVG